MKSTVLKSRKEVMSAVIYRFPGGRKNAAVQIGLSLKKFDNHTYENNDSRPLTDVQIHQLEQQTGTSFLPEYIAAMYGGLFVRLPSPETFDQVELYAMSIQVAMKRGSVDQSIAKALSDGVINPGEAAAILSKHINHMAARYAEVLAVIDLHSPNLEPRP